MCIKSTSCEIHCWIVEHFGDSTSMHSFQIFYLFLLIVMCYSFYLYYFKLFGNLFTTFIICNFVSGTGLRKWHCSSHFLFCLSFHIHMVFFLWNFSKVCFWSVSSSVHFVCLRHICSEMLSFWVWPQLVFDKKEFCPPVFQQLHLAVMF